MFYQSFQHLLDFKCPLCTSTNFLPNSPNDTYSTRTLTDGYVIEEAASGYSKRTIHLKTGEIQTFHGARIPAPNHISLYCSCQNYTRFYSWTIQFNKIDPSSGNAIYQATNIHLNQETFKYNDYSLQSSQLQNTSTLFHQHQKQFRLDDIYLPISSLDDLIKAIAKLRTYSYFA